MRAQLLQQVRLAPDAAARSRIVRSTYSTLRAMPCAETSPRATMLSGKGWSSGHSPLPAITKVRGAAALALALAGAPAALPTGTV